MYDARHQGHQRLPRHLLRSHGRQRGLAVPHLEAPVRYQRRYQQHVGHGYRMACRRRRGGVEKGHDPFPYRMERFRRVDHPVCCRSQRRKRELS